MIEDEKTKDIPPTCNGHLHADVDEDEKSEEMNGPDANNLADLALFTCNRFVCHLTNLCKTFYGDRCTMMSVGRGEIQQAWNTPS